VKESMDASHKPMRPQPWRGSKPRCAVGTAAPEKRLPPGSAEPQLGEEVRRLAKLGLGVPCADETMKPTSESLSPSGTWNRRVAECYCGAAMRRGELREAKDQPQTKVNSIRPGRLASRRIGGMRPRGWVPCEACGLGHTRSSDIARHMLTGGDVRVGGVRMVRRLHGLSQDPCGEQEPAAGGRTLMVAMKRLITVERRGVGR
jgi:hypothetical protein